MWDAGYSWWIVLLAAYNYCIGIYEKLPREKCGGRFDRVFVFSGKKKPLIVCLFILGWVELIVICVILFKLCREKLLIMVTV